MISAPGNSGTATHKRVDYKRNRIVFEKHPQSTQDIRVLQLKMNCKFAEHFLSKVHWFWHPSDVDDTYLESRFGGGRMPFRAAPKEDLSYGHWFLFVGSPVY